MAKHENTPLPYEARVRDTKGIAQGIDLHYLERPNLLRDLRRKLAWILPIVAAALSIPFIIGVGGSQRVFSNGPISRPHAIFEKKCAVCHIQAFSSVPKQACFGCHDAPSHPAKPIDSAKLISEPACSACHLEHRGGNLTEVSDKNCINCHRELNSHGTGVHLKAVSISSFRPGHHPDFPDPALTDVRPLKLNHATHMPKAAKTIRGIKLPMKCGDCHVTTLLSPKGDIEPVTFERNCQNCHKRELEFLLPGLPVNGPPAPHSKDPQAIRQFILTTYQRLISENPSLITSYLDRDMMAERSNAAWIEKASRKSEQYLFEKKCVYCHEIQGTSGEFPIIRKVNQIRGRYVEGRAEGEPWLVRAEFSHRSHRAVDCTSCHSTARTSSRTGDVLIPAMKNCADCHGTSGTSIDRCSQCHMYHNKYNERERDRRPVEQLTGRLQPEMPHVF